MKNLVIRTATALIAGGAAITAIIWSHWGLIFFCSLISLMGIIEFYKISSLRSNGLKIIGIVAAVLIWLFVILFKSGVSVEIPALLMSFSDKGWVFLPVFFVFALILLLFNPKAERPLEETGKFVLGFIYPFLPMLLLFFFGTDYQRAGEGFSYEYRIPLGILFLTWVLDSAAYLGGWLLGRTKLFERISPKKTWEGTIAGAVFCIALGVGLQYWWPVGWNWIAVGVVIAIFSQLGDLVESMLKRSVSIKDSSGILPGHGGILDRFDGLYVTIPLLYCIHPFLSMA